MNEFLSNISLIDIAIVILIIAAIVFLVKKAVGLAIGIIVILVVFQVGFNLTGQDIKDKGLEQYVGTEANNAIVSFFDDFDKRRDSTSVVDTDKLYEGMKQGVGTVIDIASNVITPENIESLSDGISDALKEAGVKDVTLKDLCDIIAAKTGTDPDNETVQEIAKQVQDKIAVENTSN